MPTAHAHASIIQAAFRAARDDGFTIEFDVEFAEYVEDGVNGVSLDIWDGPNWISLYREDR